MPVSGTYNGPAGAYLGLDVDVKTREIDAASDL
jgi:hypothetical protein